MQNLSPNLKHPLEGHAPIPKVQNAKQYPLEVKRN